MVQTPAFPRGPAPVLPAALQEAARAHEEMDRHMANLARLLQELGTAMDQHHARVTALLARASARSESSAIAELQQIQASFNMRYLQLRSQMQHENRSYAAISNVMKTKHDTAKNSISNVR